VTCEDAKAYASWAGRRLPTELEWEYSATGGKKHSRYPWGDTITPSQANYSTDSTSPVTRYQPNSFGLYDLSGNVWEWTDSWYDAYPGNEKTNSHFGEKYKVIRGGAWFYDAKHCMISYRNANDPSHAYPTVGFRTAQSLSES
jgi:formylglycine-generating enzyme